MRRVVVAGSTSAGKSTFARALAARMGLPVIELDALRHGPNWSETPDALFCARVGALTRGEGWVVDGSDAFARDLTWGRADTLVWLDYPFRVILGRLFARTNRRIRTRETLWNGNRERFANAYLSLDSLYVWLLRSFWRRRHQWPRILAQPEYRHLAVLRFRSPADAERWLQEVRPVPAPGV